MDNNPDYKYEEVGVTTYRGTVQLSGFVNTADQKTKAGDMAKGVPGVNDVLNNISVKDKMSGTGVLKPERPGSQNFMKAHMPILGMIVLAGLEALAGDLTAPNQQVPFKPTWSGDDHDIPVFTSPTNATDIPATNHWFKKASPGLTNWPATNLPPIAIGQRRTSRAGPNLPPLKAPGS